jgi:hypothetical protein
MKCGFKLVIIIAAAICLSLSTLAPANSVLKTLYIDGVQVDQVNDVGAGLSFSYPRLTIGAQGNRWYLYNEYIGAMDEFAVYPGVLSSARVSAHYAARTNYTTYSSNVTADAPLLWLKFDETDVSHDASAANSGNASGGVVATYVATADTEVLSKTAGFVTGTTAVVFPGSDEADAPGACVDVYDGGELSIGDVSIELWVKFTDINNIALNNNYPRFFQHNDSYSNISGYGLVVPNDSNQIVVLGGASSNYIDLSSDINDGAWHHVVVTYDSTYEIIPTTTYSDEVMADNPVLYLKFDQDSQDANIVDSSGNDFWAQKSNQVTIEKVAGAVGMAASLHGGFVTAANQQTDPGETVEFDHSYAFAPNDITFEFWTMTPDPEAVLNIVLFNQGDRNDPHAHAPGADRNGTAGRIYCNENRSGEAGLAYCSNGWAVDTEWHHYVITYDERPETNQININWWRDGVSYKDGVNGRTYDISVFEPFVGPEMDHILIGQLGKGLRKAEPTRIMDT